MARAGRFGTSLSPFGGGVLDTSGAFALPVPPPGGGDTSSPPTPPPEPTASGAKPKDKPKDKPAPPSSRPVAPPRQKPPSGKRNVIPPTRAPKVGAVPVVGRASANDARHFPRPKPVPIRKPAGSGGGGMGKQPYRTPKGIQGPVRPSSAVKRPAPPARFRGV